MRAIFCLGNPGREYAATRHNVGFLVADALAQRHRLEFRRSRLRALIARGNVKGVEALVVKPQTFMNDSGDAARRVAQFHKIELADVLVVYDDLALEPGTLRARRTGSDGGHKGIRSIIAHLGTQEVSRLRLGIGAQPPGMDPRNYVLSGFKPAERETVEDMVSRAADAVECWLQNGIEATMNRYNVSG